MPLMTLGIEEASSAPGMMQASLGQPELVEAPGRVALGSRFIACPSVRSGPRPEGMTEAAWKGLDFLKRLSSGADRWFCKSRRRLMLVEPKWRLRCEPCRHPDCTSPTKQRTSCAEGPGIPRSLEGGRSRMEGCEAYAQERWPEDRSTLTRTDDGQLVAARFGVFMHLESAGAWPHAATGGQGR